VIPCEKRNRKGVEVVNKSFKFRGELKSEPTKHPTFPDFTNKTFEGVICFHFQGEKEAKGGFVWGRGKA